MLKVRLQGNRPEGRTYSVADCNRSNSDDKWINRKPPHGYRKPMVTSVGTRGSVGTTTAPSSTRMPG